MIEPKFYAYFTDQHAKTEHGYEYVVLKQETPDALRKEYEDMLDQQDKLVANGEPVWR